MRIISWNVNSVRARLRAVRHVLRRYAPDVLCLQETKVSDALFPRERFEDLGYVYQALSGQKGYHGVGIVSRVPFEAVRVRIECRHLWVRLAGGLTLHNVYAPAGGDVPDPEVNPKFAEKLRFFRSLARWFRARRGEQRRAVLVGDLNIAPLPSDVWSHEQLVRVVTHTPVEVAVLDKLTASCDWVDAIRRYVPETEPLFTWWSYRAPDWKRANKGRRLDHAWVSPELESTLKSVEVLRHVRGFRRPSDHAPLRLDLSL